MDMLLYALEDRGAGISLCNLYLGGTAHANDVLTISTSTNGAIEQSHTISDFTDDSEPFLNHYHWSKTLSPKLAVEENIKKAMKRVFCSGCFWLLSWYCKSPEH